MEAPREAIRQAFEGAGIKFSPSIPEQALITAMRGVGGNASSAPYERLVDSLERLACPEDSS